MNDHKRELREQKRILKRKGHQHARREARRQLAERPEDAVEIADDLGRFRTAGLNGNDHDATRTRRQRPPASAGEPGPMP